MESEHQHFPNRLRKHRKLNRYTQKDVAFLMGFATTERISQWEHGSAMPSAINLIRLSVIYHVFPTDLYYDVMTKLRHEVDGRTKILQTIQSSF